MTRGVYYDRTYMDILVPEHWSFEKTVVRLLKEILINQEIQMAAIDDLNAAVSQLSTDVQALIAKPSGGTPDAAVQAVTDQVNALDQQVKTALGQ